MYGNPAHLDEIAVSLDDRADEIDRTLLAYLARVDRTRWLSTAADEMRATARTLAADFAGVSERYRDAAAAVRDHARAVRRVMSWIAEIEVRVRRLVSDARGRLEELGSAGLSAAGGVLGGAGDLIGGVLGIGDDDPPAPDPADVALCRADWPPPGHVDWLEHASMAGLD